MTDPDIRGLRVAEVLGTTSGGTGGHVRSSVAGLVGMGAQVVVLGPPATEADFDFTEVGAAFRPLRIADRPHPIADARTVARLARSLRGAEVVHAHGLRAGALAAVAIGVVHPAPPLVVTLHNAAPTSGRTAVIYRALERLVARRADLVLAVSPDLAERMRSLGAREVCPAVVPAPNAATPAAPGARDRLRAELEVGDRPLIFTAVRLAEQKGLPVLLDAAAEWAGREPRPLVAIAGDGPLADALRHRIDAEALPVRLLGRRSDVVDLMAAADVLVLPSLWEGQPLVLQEMLHAGRPIVATRVGGVPELTGDDAALLVPARDADALAAGVGRVLDDPALAVRLGAAAAQRATGLPSEHEAVTRLALDYMRISSLSE